MFAKSLIEILIGIALNLHSFIPHVLTILNFPVQENVLFSQTNL